MKRKFTCTNYFIMLEKNSREKTKNPNANVRARPDVTFLDVGYQSPESQLAFHIYYVKYENTLTCKRIRGCCFEKYFSISYMYNTKSDHFSPKIKQYIYGNRKSNAKS